MKTKKQINFFKFVLLTFCILMSMRATIVSAASNQTNGYVFKLATIADSTVVGGADVPFSNNGSLTDITHTAGLAAVTVAHAGYYKIDYKVNITAGIGSQLAIAVNGTVNPSTPITALVATGEVSGSAILQLAAGDIVTLRNNSATPFVMNLAPGVGAQMSITEVTENYGYAYELATIADSTVVGGADVHFSNNGPMSGINHTAGTTTFTVTNAGDYKIDYKVSITAGVGSQLAIAVNGTVDPFICPGVQSLTATGDISGSVILTLAAGDVITLRNNSPVPFVMTLAPGVGAQMSITPVGQYGFSTLSSATITPGSDAGDPILVPVSGCYRVDYNASMIAGLGGQLAVAVNDTVDPSTLISVLVGTGQVSGSVILNLTAGDLVTLRNNSLASVTLPPPPALGTRLQISLIPPVASSDCDITAWTAPAGATISGMTASKTVDNVTTSLVVNVGVSANATWKLYNDAGCNNEIADKTMNLNVGANTAYIKVTAEDGTTTKVYTVTITREAAASAVNVTLTAGKALGRADKKLEYANAKVPFTIDLSSFLQNPTSYSFDVIYDPSKVENVTVDSFNGLAKPTIGALTAADGSKKKVTVSWNGSLTGDLSAAYSAKNGVLFKLNFVVQQDFTSGETPIEIGTGSFTLSSGTSSVTGTSGKIMIGIYGDVNGDGAITSSDTNLINKYVSGKTTAITGEARLIAADVNGDGSITAADAQEISNYISGKASTLKSLFGY